MSLRMITEHARDGSDERIPIVGLAPPTLAETLAGLDPLGRRFAETCGFTAEPGDIVLLPDAQGRLATVLFGVDPADMPTRDRFQAGKLAALLPPGRYRLAEGFDDPDLACLGIELSAYRFDQFRKPKPAEISIAAPAGVDLDRLRLVAGAVAMGRDLINRPANDLGPDALEAACAALAARHGAAFTVVRGDDLARDFPMVHAVGRAAAEGPRLADMTWGRADAPKVTLVGKGVCFDTGGLDIKPESAMLLMKKDMGGAACALALAAMIMGADLPVRLRVIVPIVENSIAANAFRPGDILRSRKGLSVEVGNTDAEGRLILADALALADEEAPDLMFDFATLTGAARVALGPDLPAFYTGDEALAAGIAAHAAAAADPGWRMPLWDPYDALLKSKVADLNNIAGGGFAGSITAALFLRRFVEATPRWAHFDVYGWAPTAKPGRPEGGEVHMVRGLFDLIRHRYVGSSSGDRGGS